MTKEEKAKAYDEALERAKKMLESKRSVIVKKQALETIFPELAESEDERIRKGLIKLLTVASEAYLVESTGIKKDSYLAYLEKQKEQKPPITGNDFGWIDELKHDLEHPEELDQKVDDVLKQRKGIRALEWSDTDTIGWDEAFACVTKAEKAAKNEEELQNAVTAEKWLKEIKFKYYVHPVKQEWDEFDEDCLKRAIWYVENPAPSVVKDTNLVLWLKSLRPQPRWKPSEEQMTNLLKAEGRLRIEGESVLASKLAEIYEQLKKQM